MEVITWKNEYPLFTFERLLVFKVLLCVFNMLKKAYLSMN